MSIKVVRSEQQAAALTPLIHGVALAELLGNKDATCGIVTVDGSIEDGHPTTAKIPFDAYVIAIEGEYHLQDVATAEFFKLAKGDVTFAAKGTQLKASSPSKCKVFYVALKPFGDHTWVQNVF